MGEGTKVTRRRVFISGAEGGWERRAGCHTDGLFKPSVNGQADSQARSPLHSVAFVYFIVSSSIHRLDFLQYLPHPYTHRVSFHSRSSSSTFYYLLSLLLLLLFSPMSSSSSSSLLTLLPFVQIPSVMSSTGGTLSFIPRSLHSVDSCIGIKVESHLETHSLLYGLSPTHHFCPFSLPLLLVSL